MGKLQMCIANACSKCVKIESSRAGSGVVVFLLKLKKVKFIEQKAAIYRLGTEGRDCQWNHRKPAPKASG